MTLPHSRFFSYPPFEGSSFPLSLPLPLPSIGEAMSPEMAMTLALQGAWKGLPAVCPNPPVGCVLVDREHRFLCATHHKVFGESHAEALALDAVDSIPNSKLASMNLPLQGATLYVTLEPCSHQGKTPSCARALLQRRGMIKKVIYGLKDPNPLVAGKGLKALREGGVAVEPFPPAFHKALEEVAEIFLYQMRKQSCFFGAKVASSLDGHLAMKQGESQWISGPRALEYAHFLRACYEGILVGGDTFTMDNPRLTVRWPFSAESENAIQNPTGSRQKQKQRQRQKPNKVVVLDPEGSRLHKMKGSLLSQNHEPKEVFWVVREGLDQKKLGKKLFGKQVFPSQDLPCELVPCKTLSNGKGESLDLEDLRRQLWGRGIHSLLIEGGAYTLSSFLEVIQRFHLILSPRLLGGKSALSWSQHLEVPSLESSLFWELSSWVLLPPDMALSYKRVCATRCT